MAGRDLVPGESRDPYFGLRDSNYFNRLVRGQVKTPDTTNGKAQVDFVEICGTRQVTVPTLWFSANGRTSAWGRYMPMGGELVHLGQRNDGTPVILSYDATATKDGSPGWSEITEAQKDGRTPGFQNWRELKRGEFDFKSSGDAYIHGSNAGMLSLYGGQAWIKLEKDPYRFSSKAATYKHTSNTCEFRYGTVYRKLLPTDADEAAVQPGTFQELMFDINQSLPTGTPMPQSKAKIHFGDILMKVTNTPEMSTKTGAPLRGRIILGDAASALPVFTLEIDQIGNVVWVQSQTGIMGLDMSMFKWSALITTSTEIASAVSFSVVSPSILLGGTTAIHPLILSTPYRAAEAIMHTAVQTAHTTLSGAMTAATAAALLLANAAVGPLAPLKPGFLALQAAFTPVSPVEAAAAAAIGTFESGSPSYLSTVSKTV